MRERLEAIWAGFNDREKSLVSVMGVVALVLVVLLPVYLLSSTITALEEDNDAIELVLRDIGRAGPVLAARQAEAVASERRYDVRAPALGSYVEAQCGEFEVAIPRIEDLHRAIATEVIGKRARLTPPEIRFLRKYLDWSGADFARHMGVTVGAVSRWENGREQMGPVADRLLRLMVAHTKPGTDYSVDRLIDVAEAAPAPLRLRMELDKKGWHSKAA